MKIVLNEVELLKKALEEKYISDKPTNTIRVLIKHFYSKGFDKAKVRLSIEDFMFDIYGKNYDSFEWKVLLDGMVKSIGKKNNFVLNEIKGINITQNELSAIESLNDPHLEKIAFVVLVNSKVLNAVRGNRECWVYESSMELFKDTKMNVSKKDKELMIGKLLKLELIEKSTSNKKTNFRVKFVDFEGEVVFSITDFQNYIYDYLLWKGEKISRCEACPRLFEVNGKNHRMCRECWKAKEKGLRKEINNRYYTRNKD
jgi:hypothetical protein